MKQILLDNFAVVGGQYHALYDVISQIKVDDQVVLKADPENPHDEYAVEVWWNEYQLGFISRTKNVIVHNLLANDVPLIGLVSQVNTEYSKQVYFDVILEIS